MPGGFGDTMDHAAMLIFRGLRQNVQVDLELMKVETDPSAILDWYSEE